MEIMKGTTTVLIRGEKFTPREAARYTIEGGVMRDEIVKAVCSEGTGLAQARMPFNVSGKGKAQVRYTEVRLR